MEILRYRAFTTTELDSTSGNPAGVVTGAEDLTDADMLHIAAELGYSETAFLSSVSRDAARIRYFTPRAEIAFCGHATIASGVALARAGPRSSPSTRASSPSPVTFLTSCWSRCGSPPLTSTPHCLPPSFEAATRTRLSWCAVKRWSNWTMTPRQCWNSKTEKVGTARFPSCTGSTPPDSPPVIHSHVEGFGKTRLQDQRPLASAPTCAPGIT